MRGACIRMAVMQPPTRLPALIVEWKYEPTDFFEKPVVLHRNDCVLTIQDGTV